MDEVTWRRKSVPGREGVILLFRIELVIMEIDPEAALAPMRSPPTVLTPECPSVAAALTSLPSMVALGSLELTLPSVTLKLPLSTLSLARITSVSTAPMQSPSVVAPASLAPTTTSITLMPPTGSPALSAMASSHATVVLASLTPTTSVVTLLSPPCTVKSASSSPAATVTGMTTTCNTTGELLAPVVTAPPHLSSAVIMPQGCALPSHLTCPAQVYGVQGTLEGLVTHWKDMHEVERVFWLCPLQPKVLEC